MHLRRGGDSEEFYRSKLSSDDVVAIVGPIGDAAVAEIIGTGISKDELVAAHGSLASLSGCIRVVCWANPDRLWHRRDWHFRAK